MIGSVRGSVIREPVDDGLVVLIKAASVRVVLYDGVDVV